MHDPLPTPLPLAGEDVRTALKAATAASDENALRLLASWCNYDAVRASYASGETLASTAPRCAALRAYLAKS